MKKESLQLFQILLWNYAHHFKESWTKFFENVQQKKKFVTMLEMSGESFKWIPYLTTIFKKHSISWPQASFILGESIWVSWIPNDNGHDGSDDVSDDGSNDGSDGCFDLDTLIISLKEKIVTESSSVKYPMLLSLFKSVLSFYHGNSAPENGFAWNSSLGFMATRYKLIQ